MNLKKTLAAVAVAAATTGTALAMAAPAQADDTGAALEAIEGYQGGDMSEDVPQVLAVLDNLCGGNWAGSPAGALHVNRDTVTQYCNDYTGGDAGSDAIFSVGNNACILNWDWQRTLNFLTINDSSLYQACNNY